MFLISQSTCHASSIFTATLLTKLPVKQPYLLIRSLTPRPAAGTKNHNTGIMLKGAEMHRTALLTRKAMYIRRLLGT